MHSIDVMNPHIINVFKKVDYKLNVPTHLKKYIYAVKSINLW